ncbi:signal peptidase II [Fervidibacillus albus]|uniref:Lipoprotein signal peptidase n=1 Tax=Fervidibacillus albus TaxID=2980026 RepID=A0A9E8RWG3_9BACI|nr:signal peptidase II [Fervidibacillus albus]WAA10651.1 signal peptidase II [Fervidibacillus albus]
MFIYYVISIIVILLDQVTKWLIVNNFSLYESIPLIDGFLYITSHRNKGAAWGILEGQMWFFYLITMFVIIFIVYYMQKYGKGKRLFSFALALILGGAIGNFIDRLFRKEVVDFIDVYIFTYDYPIFNVADSALVIGVGLIIVQMIVEEKQKKR